MQLGFGEAADERGEVVHEVSVRGAGADAENASRYDRSYPAQAASACAASHTIATTVMSSDCPKLFADAAISIAGFVDSSAARANPKSSPLVFCASTTPSE